MWSRRWVIIVRCACSTLTGLSPAFAEGLGENVEEKRLVVALPEASTGLPAGELVAALRAQLSELGVAVVVSSTPFEATGEVSAEEGDLEGSALAFVWLGREGENLSVHFFESAGATLRQRRLPLRGTDAASLEEVALVVRSAVSALLERGEAEDVPPPSPEAAVQPTPTEPVATTPDNRPRSPLESPFWATVGWSGQSYADELPMSHGAAVSLGMRPTAKSWGIGVGYAFLPSQTATLGEVSVELSRHPIEAFFRFESASGGGPFHFGGEAGLLVDWSRRRSRSDAAEIAVTPDATRVSSALVGRALLGVELAPPLSLELQGGADLVLERVSTEVEGGATLVEPHRLRPRVLAQIRWNFP